MIWGPHENRKEKFNTNMEHGEVTWVMQYLTPGSYIFQINGSNGRIIFLTRILQGSDFIYRQLNSGKYFFCESLKSENMSELVLQVCNMDTDEECQVQLSHVSRIKIIVKVLYGISCGNLTEDAMKRKIGL